MESLDWDDAVGGSDDDAIDVPPAEVVVTPKHAVSPGTRDLMAFLAEGPPDVPQASKYFQYLGQRS